MPSEATHHRRVAAARNEQTILDATERLLEEGKSATIAAVAAAAGLSRPTLYAHFPDRTQLLGAVVERAVRTARETIDATQPEKGDPLDALARVAGACWEQVNRHAAVARASADELPATTRRRLHDHGFEPIRQLIARGRADGSFRTDVPDSWLLSLFYALLHATADEVIAGHADRDQAGRLLETTVRELFAARG